MTLAEVRTKANNKLGTLWFALQTRQSTYFDKHGKYFQLLASSPLTVDGEDTLFSPKSPVDEQYTIDIDYAWSDVVTFQIEVHEWVGDTIGYAGIVTIEYAGVKYRRERKSTAEDTGWYEVISMQV